MMHFFTFAGKSSHDYGIHISGESTFNRPGRKYKEYEVPGRNGTLLIEENAFKNIPVTYPAFITDEMPARIEAFANIMSSLKGYQRLEDTYAPELFRMGQYESGLEVKSSGYMNRQGEFDIVFNCKPQRFLKSGELPLTYTQNGTIYNPTAYESKPHLRIYGSGAGTVGIGSYLLTLTDIDSYVDVDCELMDAYKGAVNCNEDISFNMDEFNIPPAQSGVSITGSITSVVITPRYYII